MTFRHEGSRPGLHGANGPRDRGDRGPGSRVGFEVLFRSEFRRLGKALYLLTGDRGEAEELAQEAMARVYERWARVRTMESPTGYLYRVALHLAKKGERYPQTMTAMFGVSTIFAPLLFPMTNSLVTQVQAKEQPSQFITLLALFLVVWMLVVLVRIVRAAFEWPWPAALLLVVGEWIFSVLLFVLVFGGPSGAA